MVVVQGQVDPVVVDAVRPSAESLLIFIETPDLESAGRGLMIMTLVVSTLFVTTHLAIKACILKKMRKEDYMLMAAWLVCTAGFVTPALIRTEERRGINMQAQSVGDVRRHIILYQVGSTCYVLTGLLLKLTIIIQCLHTFSPKPLRNLTFYFSHTLIWIHCLVNIPSIIFSIVNGVRALQNSSAFVANDKWYSFVVFAVFGTLSDFAILALPQRAIWRLHMPVGRRFAVSAVFAVGLVGCAAASLRVYYAAQIYTAENHNRYRTLFGLCAYPEFVSGFLVACLPTLPKLITHTYTALATRYPSLLTAPGGSKSSRKGSEGVAPLFVGGNSNGMGTVGSGPKRMRTLSSDVTLVEFEREMRMGSDASFVSTVSSLNKPLPAVPMGDVDVEGHGRGRGRESRGFVWREGGWQMAG